ncbi:MAG: hypothetical protein R3E57_05645 [Porticoccaceae bacterium]
MIEGARSAGPSEIALHLSAGGLKFPQRYNLLVALEKCQGKVFGSGGAAELLGIKPTTLASRIRKYRIDPRQFKLGIA